LLLVVAGFVFSQANTFPAARTDDALIARYEKAGKLGLFPFLLSLVEAACCGLWFVHRSDSLLWCDVYGFFLLLIFTGAYGSVLILRYL
jgi:hypothetical protein